MAREKGRRGGSNAAQPERDSRDARITELERENDRLKRENNRLERETDRLERETDRLERETDHLKQQLESVRRAGRRQAAPFAKDRPQGDGKRPGRRSGAARSTAGTDAVPARLGSTKPTKPTQHLSPRPAQTAAARLK